MTTRRSRALVVFLLFVCLPFLLLLPFRRRLDAILMPTSSIGAQRRQLLECKRRERTWVIKYVIKNWDRKSYLSTVTEKRQRQLNGQRVFLVFLLARVRCDTADTVIWIKRYGTRDKRAPVCRQKLNTWGRAIDRSASHAQTQNAGTENRITRDLMPLPEIWDSFRTFFGLSPRSSDLCYKSLRLFHSNSWTLFVSTLSAMLIKYRVFL